MVIRSKALTTTKCHASYSNVSTPDTTKVRISRINRIATYTQVDKIDERNHKSTCCNKAHNSNVIERIPIELESRGLWEEH